MAYPGSCYGYDVKGNQLIWDPVRPPPRWVYCPNVDVREPRHYKPDDGAKCCYCGFEPERQPESEDRRDSHASSTDHPR